MTYWIVWEEYSYDWDEQHAESFENIAQCRERYIALTNQKSGSSCGVRVLQVYYGMRLYWDMVYNPDTKKWEQVEIAKHD